MKIFYALLLMVFIFSACKPSANNQQEKYKEQYRQQIHFSPDSMWMNDPNGMVYYDGEYHLFFQHNPDSTIWGPMHWGHAISTDLIHWKQMPIALYPDSLGWIYSGCVVADLNNTSGLGTMENPPLVAIFTYHNRPLEDMGSNVFEYQGLAYSLDKGRTWTKYQHNPVLPNPGIRDFRDPKIFWHEESSRWIMVIAALDHLKIYSSPNLISWMYESDFGKGIGAHSGMWECPDLFPMKVADTTKWVLLVSINPGGPNGGSSTQYFVGDFDGHCYVPMETKTKWLDYGKDNYAGVTWSNVPEKDDRRLFLGWMNNWEYANEIPTSGWRGTCTLPRTLELTEIYNDYLLVSNPVKEFEQLRGKGQHIKPGPVAGELRIKETFKLPLEIKLDFDTRNSSALNFAERFGIILSNDKNEKLLIGYDNFNKLFFVDRTAAGWDNTGKDFAGLHYAPYINNDPTLDIHLVIDKTSVEVFAKGGLVVMTEQFFPSEEFSNIELFAQKGEVNLEKGSITQLTDIWGK